MGELTCGWHPYVESCNGVVTHIGMDGPNQPVPLCENHADAWTSLRHRAPRPKSLDTLLDEGGFEMPGNPGPAYLGGPKLGGYMQGGSRMGWKGSMGYE